MTRAEWTEPNRRIPLRWGTYLGRYLGGLAYVVAGLVLLPATNTYTVFFLLIGTVAHTAGWLVLPSTGARRLWAFWPSLISIWLLLTGPQILYVMAAPLLSWLIVRQRPARSYVVLILPIAVGIVLAYSFHTNHDEPLALGLEGATVVASAWLARLLAGTRRVLPVEVARETAPRAEL